MNTLFRDIINGNTSYATESAQLSYAEESAIENEITHDSESLVSFNMEGFMAWVAIEGALNTSEGYAAAEIASGKSRDIALESLSSRASNAYATIKKWATKIWKAIKKFVQKAWNHLKAIKDRIKAFFTNYENVLKGYNGDFTIKNWCEMHIAKAAEQINKDYKGYVEDLDNGVSNHAITKGDESLVVHTLKLWRHILYDNVEGTPVFKDAKWKQKKGEVLQIVKIGYDQYASDFLKWGEKDYKEAMDLDEERISDREDQYDEIDRDDYQDNKGHTKKKYYTERDKGRTNLQEVRTRLHLRQRGIVLLNGAINRQYNQCLSAARQAIKESNGVKENYNVVDSKDYNLISSMI